MTVFFFTWIHKTFIYVFPTCCRLVIFRAILLSRLPDSQIDTYECVFVWVRERQTEWMEGGKSLAYTAISDHLQLLWQWSSVAYQDSLGDRGVHSGNSSCYQGTQRWQVVSLLESIFCNFLTATCLVVEIEQCSPLSVLSFFKRRVS